MGSTTWRGVALDQRTASMMDEAARLAGFDFQPSQGSWSGAAASAGTHSGCGAIDITNLDAAHCNALVDAMRRVGFAAWHRTPEQSDWVRHVHGIAVQPGGKGDRGCLHSSAHDQVIDYYEGRNGLASGAPDDGPREHVGTTWESYQQQAGKDDDMTPEQAKTLGDIAWLCGQIKGQTDQINPRMMQPVDQTQWTVDQMKNVQLPSIEERLAAIEAKLA